MYNQKTVSILVAYTKKDRVIGANGKIPWHLNSERNRFKQICSGKKIIMGRKSFEEIGKPLPYCSIIVVSSTLKKLEFTNKGTKGSVPSDKKLLSQALQGSVPSVTSSCFLSATLESALNIASLDSTTSEILIAGGEEIYKQTLAYADKIYATEIDADFEGDSHFPELKGNWNCVEEASCTENDITYKYLTFTKK